MKELLKELEEMLMESSNYTKENRNSALSKIREELSRPVEPVGWYCPHCRTGVDGSEVTYHEQHQACGTYMGDTSPPKKPVLLSVDDVWDAYVRSTLQVMSSEQDDIHSFALELEQAVLKANGLGGVE